MDGVVAERAPQVGEPVPVRLINTIWADRQGVHDALETPAHAAAWLREVRGRLLVDARSDDRLWEADAREVGQRLRLLRDALRRLAAEVTGDGRAAAASPVTDLGAAVAAFNAACALAPVWSELTWQAGGAPQPVLRTAHTLYELTIAQLAEQAVDLLAAPSPLRACQGPGCVLYFVKDHPRREWCSAACGNRARVARHYQRHHGGADR